MDKQEPDVLSNIDWVLDIATLAIPVQFGRKGITPDGSWDFTEPAIRPMSKPNYDSLQDLKNMLSLGWEVVISMPMNVRGTPIAWIVLKKPL